MLADPLWFNYSLSLLDGTLDRQDEKEFTDSMNALVCYVEAKNNGRCLSTRIFKENKRSKMISELFIMYHENKPVSELCQMPFMRELTWHNSDNDENFEYLEKTVVIAQVKLAKFPEVIYRDPCALAWIKDLNATTADPKTVAQQRECLKGIPQEMQIRLSEGRRKIGGELVHAVKQKWINLQDFEEVIKGIEAQNSGEHEPIVLTECHAIAYFTQSYLNLIESGEEYKNFYRVSLLCGLNGLKKDPIFTAI